MKLSLILPTLILLSICLAFKKASATGLNFQTVIGNVQSANLQSLPDDAVLKIGTMNTQNFSGLSDLDDYEAIFNPIASAGFTAGEVGIVIPEGTLPQGENLYGIAYRDEITPNEAVVFYIGKTPVSPELGILIGLPATSQVVWGSKAGNDLVMKISATEVDAGSDGEASSENSGDNDDGGNQANPDTDNPNDTTPGDSPANPETDNSNDNSTGGAPANPIVDNPNDTTSGDSPANPVVDDPDSQTTSPTTVDPNYLWLIENGSGVWTQSLFWSITYNWPSAPDNGVWFFMYQTQRWYWSSPNIFPYLFDYSTKNYVYITEQEDVSFLYDFQARDWQIVNQ